MTKIIVKHAISRKPQHMYWIDRHGNMIEEPYNTMQLSFFEKLKCKYIDLKRKVGLR